MRARHLQQPAGGQRGAEIGAFLGGGLLGEEHRGVSLENPAIVAGGEIERRGIERDMQLAEFAGT